MKLSRRIIAFFACFVVIVSTISSVAYANFSDAADYGKEALETWLHDATFVDPTKPFSQYWTPVGYLDALFASNKSQKYYTTPTSSVQDKYGKCDFLLVKIGPNMNPKHIDILIVGCHSNIGAVRFYPCCDML